jgi:hypothetical protein
MRSWLLSTRLLGDGLTAARVCASLPAALLGTTLLPLPHATSIAIPCLAFFLHRCNKIQATHDAGDVPVWAPGLIGLAALKRRGEMEK